jgi:hypothetical protein
MPVAIRRERVVCTPRRHERLAEQLPRGGVAGVVRDGALQVLAARARRRLQVLVAERKSQQRAVLARASIRSKLASAEERGASASSRRKCAT